MTKFEEWYLQTAEKIITEGTRVVDRTGTGTISTFTQDYTHNLLEQPYPILSCRKFDFTQPITEMIGFMLGITNSEWFAERGCPFWNGFGLPADATQKKRREDHELAEEYCSHKGKYKAHEPEYRARYKMLNSTTHEAGLKMITDEDVSLYKEIIIGKKGDLGPIYGHMWRHWPKGNGYEFDQLKYAFDELRIRPYNRRILVNGWNPSFMPDFDKEPHENVLEGNMSLTPCHVLHEYHTAPIPLAERVRLRGQKATTSESVAWEAATNKNKTEEQLHSLLDDLDVPRYYLDICWFQRSWDFMLGAPANIAGYTSMLMMMAKLQGMVARYVSVRAVNVHVYTNHLPGLKTILERAEMGIVPDCSPKLNIDDKGITFIDQFKTENFTLEDYDHLPHVKFPVSF